MSGRRWSESEGLAVSRLTYSIRLKRRKDEKMSEDKELELLLQLSLIQDHAKKGVTVIDELLGSMQDLQKEWSLRQVREYLTAVATRAKEAKDYTERRK
jgi:hypothetical protein